MELIPYTQFAKLRLKQFVEDDVQISGTDEWEWMGGFWFNEGVNGFTSFSRPQNNPTETGGLEIDFSDFPEKSARAILDMIHLPLRCGMKMEEVYSVLGEPKEKDVLGKYVHDRQTDNFKVGSSQPYYVSCTVHEDNGLTFLTVIRGDVLAKIAKEQAAAT